MSYEEKMKQLDQIEDEDFYDEESFLKLIMFSKDKESMIRLQVAELLADYPEELRAQKVLLSLTNDKHHLVRTEACDSLGSFPKEEVATQLKIKSENDKHYLVRGYAILSLVDNALELKKLSEDTVSFLEQKLAFEKKLFVKLCCYQGLYMLGHKVYLENIVRLIKSRSYNLRCSVINSFLDIVDKQNVAQLKCIVNQQYKIEDTRLIKSYIEGFLDFCEEKGF